MVADVIPFVIEGLDSGFIMDITLSSHIGFRCIQMDYGPNDESLTRILYIPLELVGVDKITLRAVVSEPGFTSSSVINQGYDGPPVYTSSEMIGWWNEKIAPVKVLIISDWTNGTVISQTLLEQSPIANKLSCVNNVTMAVSNSEALISSDLCMALSQLDSEGPPFINNAGFPIPSTPATPIGGSVDLSQITKALQDIALRDFQVSFNHGAQQLSATGAVAIP